METTIKSVLTLPTTDETPIMVLDDDDDESKSLFELFGKGKTLKDLDVWNITTSLEEIPLDANFAWLLFLLLVSLIWVTYCIYYNSRVFAFFFTLLTNSIIIPRYFLSDNGSSSSSYKKRPQFYFRVGSLSISFISGKIMFRDIAFITADYTLRAQDGFLIFRWWLPYFPKDVRRTDLSHSDTRLSVVLNGFEYHVYNRTDTYLRLEKLFNLPSRLFPEKQPQEDKESVSDSEQLNNVATDKAKKEPIQTNDGLIKAYLWRDFIPVTKFEISTGRIVYGNSTTPSALSIRFEEAHITYTSRPALSPHDLFTHIAKAKAESFKIILVPSPKYIGLTDEPPRYMGEGFVIFQSNCVDFYYFQDEPGFVSLEPENIELPTGDVVQRFTSPAWGMDVKCGKGTDFSYGPWADRQREFLYNFFYPPDYQVTEVDPKPKLGDLRQFETFDFRLSTVADASVDLLFCKNKETHALHINAGPGSYLEVTIPWITKETGYESHILGQILHLDATTSLNFRSLAQSETLEFDVRIRYPKLWNEHQEWTCSLTGCKATVEIIFAHKWFFCDLIDDWSSKGKPDILNFIPYTWKFSVLLKEFELIVLANEHNWIDCSSNPLNENVQLAICGDTFDLSFDLPFVEYLPKTVPIKLWIQGESLEAAIYLPEANPHRDVVEMLHSSAKLSPLRPTTDFSSAANKTADVFPPGKRWRNISTKENGWTPCWSVPIVAVSVTFTYHPMPPLDLSLKDADVATPEREEVLLESIRPNASSVTMRRAQVPKDFDPGSLDPDFVELEVEIGPSTLCLYGVILRMLWDIKENYLGESQQFTDFTASPDLSKADKEGPLIAHFSTVTFADQGSPVLKPFDARLYRPLAVNVSLAMHDIHAHLMKACTDTDPTVPYIYLERLSFEMEKVYRETKLQLLLSPTIMNASDCFSRSASHAHINDGFLVLDALQFRGHAMFSGIGRPLDSDTLEYGWLVEVALGEVSGRLTLPQLAHVVNSVEALFLQVTQDDSALQPPVPYRKCLHDRLQSVCPDSDSNMNKLCPYSEDLKYRMVRLSLACIDISLVESNALLNVRLVPLKMATCNLHSCHTNSGVTLLIDKLTIRQFALQNPVHSSIKASKLHLLQNNGKHEAEAVWLEVSAVTTGPIFIDTATLLSVIDNYSTTQDTFLRTHDTKTKRLWFLWRKKSRIAEERVEEALAFDIDDTAMQRCGCIGGCAFFGNNTSGLTFFDLRKPSKRGSQTRAHAETLHSPGDDYQPGESLLHRGEAVLGFPLHTVLSCLEDDDELASLDLFPFASKTSDLGPLSSPLRPPDESPSFPRLSSTHPRSSTKRPFFSRQLSSPARGSPYAAVPAHSRSDLSSAASISPSGHLNYPTGAFSDNEATPPSLRAHPADGLAPSDAIPIPRLRSLSDGGGGTEQDVQSEILSDILRDQAQFKIGQLAERSKSLESASTLTEPYFSADEGDSSSESETLKQYMSAKTHLQGTTTTSAKTMSVLSDDTFKSLTSITMDNHPSMTGDPTLGSVGQLPCSHSHTSLRSTFSAPPAHADQSDKVFDTRSMGSSSSFMSAASSQQDKTGNADNEEDDFNVDDTLVDLHNQMEKPIVESPLLMAVYNQYLTRHPFGDWSTTRPPFPCGAFHQTQERADSMTHVGGSGRRVRWTPRFVRTVDGFSSLKLVPKRDYWDPVASSTTDFRVGSHGRQQSGAQAKEHSIGEQFSPGRVYQEIREEDDIEEQKYEKEESKKEHDDGDAIEVVDENEQEQKDIVRRQVSKTYEFKSEKLTILVKFNGDTDIKVSPLSLDGLKTLIDALQPTLTSVHPLGILNHLNLLCSGNVQDRNILKKERMLHLGQLKVNAWRSTLERERSLQKIASTMMIFKDLTSGGGDAHHQHAQAIASVNSNLVVNQYEETRRTKTQAFIHVARVNVILLQTSLVEQVISFSALDNMKDLTCVSVMAASLGSVDLSIQKDLKEIRTLKTFISNNPRTVPGSSAFANFAQKDLVARLFSKKPKKKTAEVEPVTVETQKILSEESVAIAKVATLHAQLSRLKTSSSILKEAVLTVIPRDQSKVFFSLESSLLPTPACSPLISRRKSSGASRGILKRQEAQHKDWDDVFVEVRPETTTTLTACSDEGSVAPSLLSGFIMFECGLERISVDAVKKKVTDADCPQPPKAAEDSKEDDGKAGEDEEIEEHLHRPKGASSFVVELGALWCNFAAPPKTPNTKKIDYTRLDWHLLSTGTPSINAWLSAGDRLLFSGKKLSRLAEQRQDAVVASLMTLALEVQGIHIPPQTKYLARKRTPLAKTLQEDPSCQLIYVLRRYLKQKASYEELENTLKPEQLPGLGELRRGVIALSRQWKNALYMPLLVEQNIKHGDGHASAYQIPLKVLFGEKATSAPSSNYEKALSDLTSPQSQDSGASAGARKVTSAESSTQAEMKTAQSKTASDSGGDGLKGQGSPSADGSVGGPEVNITVADVDNVPVQNGTNVKQRKYSATNFANLGARSSRASVAFPLLTAPLETLGSGVGKAVELGRGLLFSPNSMNSTGNKVRRNDSQGSLRSPSSTSLSSDENYQEENLYNWMSRQQEYMESKAPLIRKPSAPRDIAQSYDVRYNTLASANSFGEDDAAGMQLRGDMDVPPGFAFLSTGVIADVRLIFEPLLTGLGVRQLLDEGSDVTFEQLGPRVSLSGTVKLFRVDIVESEARDFTPSGSRSRTPTNISPTGTLKKSTMPNLQVPPLSSRISFMDTMSRFIPENNLENAAFLCDRLVVDLDLRKVKDFEKERERGSTMNLNSERPAAGDGAATGNVPKSTSDDKVPIVIVGPDGGISQVTTVVNFCVDVSNITQRVNLPLLRLLHQFASMVETVKETRLEMKANRTEILKEELLHRIRRKSRNAFDSEDIEPLGTISATPSSISLRPSSLKQNSPAAYNRDSFNFEDIDAASDITLIGNEEEAQVVPEQAKCWRTMFYLLDLYEMTPETKTVTATEKPPPTNPETKVTIEEEPSTLPQKTKSGHEQHSEVCIEMDELSTPTGQHRQVPPPAVATASQHGIAASAQRKSMNMVSSDQIKNYTQALMHRELTPLVVFGIVKIRKVDLVAMLSGLKLEGQLTSFHVSLTHKEKVRGAAVSPKKWRESSLTGKLGQTTLALLEEIPGNQQLVVKMGIGKSQILLSSQNKKGKDSNSALLTIGPIGIDIPQHPVALHNMVTRSHRQLSTTLNELRSSSRQPSRSSRHNADSQVDASTSYATAPPPDGEQKARQKSKRDFDVRGTLQKSPTKDPPQQLIKPIVVQFSVILDSFTIGAALLPSLRAQYQIGQVTSSGTTGNKAKFVVDVREHHLSFNTNVVSLEANLPSSASVALPPIHIVAEYIEDPQKQDMFGSKSESFGSEGIVLRKGSFFNALADIGAFEHSLTTDLLNHLLLVQKVFMKEVNEVVQKMSGGDMGAAAAAASTEDSDEQSKEQTSSLLRTRSGRYILFSLHLRLQGIQITATTPTSSAVRLETGTLELQVSNRVQNMSTMGGLSGDNFNLKTFVKLQVDLNVALGQLIKNALFEEAEPEFQQLAYFKTRIVTRNALQDELVSSTVAASTQDDKEAVLITLNRPLLYIQPLALDKAVLVWLNYKNAYEYWNEQRANLNKEVLTATQQVLGKVQQPIAALSSQALGTLFLQLTIDDLGICLPVGQNTPAVGAASTLGAKLNYDSELKSALVITLLSTRISACSCGSLVSKAKFTGLCFRFVDDFETSLDDWKPDPSDPTVMNLCQVSEGTYEICSRTTTAVQSVSGGDAKWVLNVTWKMEGFDIHVDTSIGKQLSGLFKTLTALAGDEDELDAETVDYSSVVGTEGATVVGLDSASSPLPGTEREQKPATPGEPMTDVDGALLRRGSIFKDSSTDTKKRSRLIEKELNEQAKIINDLRQLGASQSTIEQEIKRLHELESVVFNDFRRDVIKKLRRQSVKSSNFRENKVPPFSRMQSLASPDGPGELAFRKTPLKTLESVDSENSTEGAFDTVTQVEKTDVSKKPPSTALHQTTPGSTAGRISSGSGSEASLLQLLTRSPDGSTPSVEDRSLSLRELPSGSSASSPLSESAREPVFVPEIVTTSHSRRDSLVDFSSRQSSGSSSAGGQVHNPQKQSSHQLQEPNIDFELDVMIFFNSGKCVFHTRDTMKGADDEAASGHSSARKAGLPRDRSFVGNPYDVPSAPSPKTVHPRYQVRSSSTSLGGKQHPTTSSNFRANLSSSKLRGYLATGGTPADFTMFLIPGLDVKVHYNSKTVYVDSPQCGSSTSFTASNLQGRPGVSKDLEFQTSSSSFAKKMGTKKASCYAWMTLHSIPEETVITPHFLDFLEQALEPIPIDIPQASHLSTKTPSPTTEHNPGARPSEDDMLSSAPAQYAVYGSFPVDVIVYLHVQPSVLRFSCLPVSRVECLLQLPSVDLVFSSKRNRDELTDVTGGASGSSSVPPGASAKAPTAKMKQQRHRRAASDHCRNPASGANPQIESSVGGLSVSGRLADFSLYIFHPYGGQKKSSSSTLTNQASTESTAAGSPPRSYDRKDSLSLQVEFVKVNVSRSRKLLFSLETSGPPKFGQALPERHCHTAMIRFSALCDIGSASFKYDMRRLTEILAFPRAWYRKAIWKRMFLGDESVQGTLFSDPEDEEAATPDPQSEQPTGGDDSSSSGESLDDVKPMPPKATVRSPPMKRQDTVNRETLWLNLSEAGKKASREGQPRTVEWRSQTSSAIRPPQQLPWETLLLFGVNLSKLSVQMNMGNVMGNTSWLTRGFRSEGRVSIDSTGHKCLSVGVGCDGSSLDAKGGIVGGTIELSAIETRLTVQEDRGKEPDHTVKLSLHSLEQKLDYMGTSVLMTRISELDLTLRDEWRVDHLHGSRAGGDHPTKRPALIFIHSQLHWDQLQVLMSKSTTPDILKMTAKLEEFFSQQFHSSKRVLSSLQPSRSFNRSSSFKSKSRKDKAAAGLPHQDSVSLNTEARHHRHWQNALRLVSGVSLSTLPQPLPAFGTILGGTVELSGKNISLACFYGINFRSKAWGLFSLREPTISFATEAQDIMNDSNSLDTHIIQNLSISLGRSHQHQHQQFDAQHISMATVCRISRSVMFPPQFRHMHEWFQYAFASSNLDEVTRFPVMEFERPDGVSPTFSEGIGQEGKRRVSASPKGQELHHNKEVIFAFPSFQMDLKTEHLQGPRTPSTSQTKPSVDCTFVTDFDDHIFVAVDAEAYFFLHELITSYIREKDVNVAGKSQSPSSSRGMKSDSIETLHTDWREYVCQTWHLEPTVRLLSWAGKNIEPYGVDYILQRLGFSQARTTIPKWIQRGAMDPLDKILSVVMYRIIRANAIEGKATVGADSDK